MELEQLIDRINLKISGLNTLQIEKSLDGTCIYLCKVRYPTEERILLGVFRYENKEISVVDYLLQILMTQVYKQWENYDLVKENYE